MRKIQFLAVAGLASLGLATGACDRRAPTADTQGKGYVESRDPNRQPVSGTEATTPPARAPAVETPPAAMATTHEIYWVDADGKRSLISDTMIVTQMQQKMREVGVYEGPTDGTLANDLEPSLRQYQIRRSLPETGTLDERTAREMGIAWEKVRGTTAGEKIEAAGEQLKESAKEVGRELKVDAKKTKEDLKEGARDMKELVEPQPPTPPKY